MINGQVVKDYGVWGGQDGLLSVGEIERLYTTLYDLDRNIQLLEVGHYCGLSTYVMHKALTQGLCSSWRITTIDAHIVDPWVKDSDAGIYFANRKRFFPSKNIQTIIMNSEAVQCLDGFNVVFYDGDHGMEQYRWTKMVNDSPDVGMFIFDDADFEVPAMCCQYLEESGWLTDRKTYTRGHGDKRNPATDTLAVWWRA